MCNLGEGLIEKYEKRGIARGEVIGEVRGEAKKSREIAERMLKRNMSMEEVVICTGLTETKVAELKRKMK